MLVIWCGWWKRSAGSVIEMFVPCRFELPSLKIRLSNWWNGILLRDLRVWESKSAFENLLWTFFFWFPVRHSDLRQIVQVNLWICGQVWQARNARRARVESDGRILDGCKLDRFATRARIGGHIIESGAWGMTHRMTLDLPVTIQSHWHWLGHVTSRWPHLTLHVADVEVVHFFVDVRKTALDRDVGERSRARSIHWCSFWIF